MTTLAQDHDCLLLDLDGTVFRGQEATTGAVETLAAVEARTLYVTNNASRGPDEVAQHLIELGFAAAAATTSSPARRVLRVCWRPNCLRDQPFSSSAPIRSRPRCAMSGCSRCGCSPTTRSPSYRGTHRRRGGPTSRRPRWRSAPAPSGSRRTSTAPCHPSAACCPGTARWSPRCAPPPTSEPQVAGKPAPTLLTDALGRGQFDNPLVVGDRLDTDIAGANAAGLPSLLVLTGVSTAADMVFAFPRSARTTLPPICVRSMRPATPYGSDRIRRGTSRSAPTR